MKLKNTIHSQTGYGLLTTMALVFASALLFLLHLAMTQLSIKQEHDKWLRIAFTSNVILKGVEKYFEYDCYPDGVVSLPNYQTLVKDGFINTQLIENPYDYNYSVAMSRPTYSFNNAGLAIPDGITTFTVDIYVSDSEQKEKFEGALNELQMDFSVSGNVYSVRAKHNLTENQLNNQFLNGNMSFTCA